MDDRERLPLRLAGVAASIRRDILDMIGCGGKVGHLGGSLSAVELVAVLYFQAMRHDPGNPDWQARDRFILSKGHAALVQYAVLAEAGYFPKAELGAVKQLGAMLQGHPDRRRTPGVEANTGSLGQGLSLGVGMALEVRLDAVGSRVFVLLGDGELNEGQVWEAASCAAHYGLNNLTAIVDINGLQASGTTCAVQYPQDIADKWRAFGWETRELDGHDLEQILDGYAWALGRSRPGVILARTVKGKGVSFAENRMECHNCAMTKEEYAMACQEVAWCEE